jgi:RimJ/RimL family protein N-acetyltransferase
LSKPVYGRNQYVAAFVARQLGFSRGFEAFTAIGFGEPLEAGIVYHNWNPEAGLIELTAASKSRSWLNKANLAAIFDYPFGQLGCQLCIARISEHNARARRIWRALGATEYVIPRLRGPNEAEVIATLTREAWEERTHRGKAKSADSA